MKLFLKYLLSFAVLCSFIGIVIFVNTSPLALAWFTKAIFFALLSGITILGTILIKFVIFGEEKQ